MYKQQISKYMGIAFLIALFFIIGNVVLSTGHLRGFGHGLSVLALLTVAPGLGMFIGNIIRVKLMPDAIFTSEGIVGIAKAKIFWAIGPQVIGWFAGLLAIGEFIA